MNYVNKETIKRAEIKEIVERALEMNMLDATIKSIRKFTRKAMAELIELNRNNTTRTLQLFIEAQQHLFIGSLGTLQT